MSVTVKTAALYLVIAAVAAGWVALSIKIATHWIGAL